MEEDPSLAEGLVHNIALRLVRLAGENARLNGLQGAVDVTVGDTTAPVVACNAPASIFPPSSPVSFQASAGDACGTTSP